MRKLIIIGILFAWSTTMLAQASFIVIRTSGKVEYRESKGDTPKRVLAGTEIPSVGTLNLGSGSAAKLLYSGKPIELKKKGKYDLKLLIDNKKSQGGRSFMSRFWSFINEGISNTGDSEKLQKYHQKYMEEATGGISGFSEAGNQIVTLDIGTGVMAEDAVTFQWRPLSNAPVFNFQIYESESKELVFKGMTRDTFLHLDLKNIHLEEGIEHYWIVGTTADDDKKIQSQKKFFNIQPDNKQEILANLVGLEDYNLAEDIEKQLIQSHIFESEGLLYSAHSVYLEMMHSYPENELVMRLYRAFLARNNSL